MTNDEFLSRMDAHLERFDAHMERMDVQGERLDTHMARHGELMEHIEREHQLNREAFGSLVRLVMDTIERNAQAFDRNFHVLDEMRADIRAQTAAIFRVIDRLDGGASAAGA